MARISSMWSFALLFVASYLLVTPTFGALVLFLNTSTPSYVINMEYFDNAVPLSEDAFGVAVTSGWLDASLTLTPALDASALIVLLPVPTTQLLVDVRDKLLEIQGRGVKAIILDGFERMGYYMYLTTIGSTPEYTIPIYSMPGPLFAEVSMVLNSGPVNASLTVAGNANQYRTVNESILIAIIFGLAAVVNVTGLVFAIVQLTFFVKARGCNGSIAIYALTIDIFAFAIGATFYVVDPGIRRIMPRQMAQILITFYLPFFFVANILVILFWIEVLSRKRIKKYKRLGALVRLRVPFIIICCYLIGAELTTSILRVFVETPLFVFITIINLFLSLVLITVCIFVVIHRINESQGDGFVVNTRLTNMSKYMKIMAGLCIAAAALLIVMAFLRNDNPWLSVSFVPIPTMVMAAVTISQVNLFRVGSSGSKKDSTSDFPTNDSSKKSANMESADSKTTHHSSASE